MRIDDLKPASYNPRRISPEALAGLKSSLVQFGDIAGLTWNKRTGNMVAGHQRLRALRSVYGDQLILEEAPHGAVLRAPKFCDVIVARWEKFTGRRATKA
jgi:hypothetical protein